MASTPSPVLPSANSCAAARYSGSSWRMICVTLSGLMPVGLQHMQERAPRHGTVLHRVADEDQPQARSSASRNSLWASLCPSIDASSMTTGRRR